ncbi:heterokaryon incompatibility protein-domain-containing protein [Macrophomina phaseolina]|uniref:Heterokaryon incompatibility protein-domain-containing protein n=1 Tax=Macrophomina phaseolina TaxID=35725 RepID=A0ABQ8G6M5_9PEZI|nr:heterokaryon incompatibility protein-domain-containing protein [Macrophomina phaseolina]
MLLRAFGRCCNDDDGNIDIVREGASLKREPRGPRLLRFCADPEYVDRTDYGIPIGLPIPPEPDDPARFALLRAWLSWCDDSHGCNKHRGESKTALPTRVLYVGDPKGSGYDLDSVRLVCASETSSHKYIALSHCWGKLSDEEKKGFCTTRANIGQRLRGFSLSELPKTFRDAVKVTRELGVLYLWIDSLCIIQYGDNGEDWKSESGRMETVFSAAYCTIAAASADNSNAGFLERGVSTGYVSVQGAPGKRFYISDDIDDFDNDVGKALLSTRAWVMQERVLAQRTIHFTANQTYWECGEGIYCENLTRLESSSEKTYFTLDPNFPSRLLKSGRQRTIDFIQYLSENYSKMELTFETDRCVAISGLENLIASALSCQSRYGIFQRYIHRGLLWQASDNKMERIAYNNRHVPSWSWMAYSGAIQFINIPFGSVDWINYLRFDEERDYAIIADVAAFTNCTMELHGKQYTVSDSSGTERGWIRYDVEDGEELCQERCVVVGMVRNGRFKDCCYIMIVRPTGVDGEYRRVGVGLIHSGRVVRWKINVRVV